MSIANIFVLRTTFTRIIFRNILTTTIQLYNFFFYAGTEHNFRKQSYENTDSKGTPYDYQSMMHYSFDAFGSGRMTIQTKDPKMQYEIGNGRGDWGFSPIDVEQLNKLYGCSKYKTEYHNYK